MASWEEFSRIVAEAKASKKLDPVGHEDDDVDNDGDSDSSDSYLKKRRATVGAAIAADKMKKEEFELDEASYSAKSARAGKDIGKPGKNFAKIAKSAGEKYGSEEAGKRVAGAVLAKLRKEALDPVGQEDKDIDNDGDHDKSDKYLLNRRKVRAKVIPPQERLKTDRDMFNIPKSEQEAARERILAKAKAKRMKEEVEQIDEIAPLVVGGLAAAAAAPYLLKKFAKPAVDKAIDKQRSTQPGDYKVPARQGGLGAITARMRTGGIPEDYQQNSYQPEGEMVEEDKEYRREMRKAAARERAEEKKAETEFRSRGRRGEKKKGPKLSTTPITDRTAKSYVDKELGAIKYMERKTKGKHTIGNPFPENYDIDGEYIEEGGMSKDEMLSAIKGHKYSKKELLDMSKKSTKEGRHGEAAAFYHEFQKEENEIEEAKKSDYLDDKLPSDEKLGYGFSDNKKRVKDLKKLKRLVKHYDGMKKGDPMYNSYQPEGEQLDEKALSRAQQRFMGMVYAAKKGETPASPEVAKAASGMSKKAARDFAKTKHEGLPEKKEETKEELSLVDRVLVEASDAQIMAARARREDRAKKQQARLRQAKVSVAGAQALKEPEAETKKTEKQRKEEAKKEVKSKNTATERAARTTAAARVRAARIERETQREKETARTERQRERFSYTDEKEKRREAKKSAEEAKKEKDREEKEFQNKRKAEREALKKERSQIFNVKFSKTSDKDTEGDAASNVASNIGSILTIAGRAGKAGIKYALQKRKERREDEERKKKEEGTQKEQFSNWREEFIFEVDDQSIKEPQQKVIDVTKKKNKIEINPNMSEGCGCEEKEENEKPKKDMRELPTKVNLIKNKMRSMGIRNPMVMVVSKEETESIQEVAPLLAGLARVAGGAVSRGVATRVAGGAAQGTLRSKAAEMIGRKAGETVQDRLDKNLQKKTEPVPMSDNPLAGIWQGVVPEGYVEEGMTLKDFKKNRSRQKQKDKREAEKTSPLRRAGIHDDKASPERDARHRANVDPDFDGDDSVNYPGGKLKNPKKIRKAKALGELGESAAWTKKEGKSEAGGLNEKGRKSYERENPGSDLKAPSKEVGNPRRASFCARMSGMKAKLTSKKTANDPDSRINKSLRAWNC